MKSFKAETMLAVCVLGVAAIYLWQDAALPPTRLGDPLGPKAFPALVGAGLILSALLLFFEVWKKSRAAKLHPDEHGPGKPVDKHQLVILCCVVAWTALYYSTFELLGYLIATPIFILGLLCHFHRGHYKTNISVAVGFTAVVYALFALFLGVPMPTGPLPI